MAPPLVTITDANGAVLGRQREGRWLPARSGAAPTSPPRATTPAAATPAAAGAGPNPAPTLDELEDRLYDHLFEEHRRG